MNSIINTKANGEDTSAGRENIDGDIPEMEKPNDINECKSDSEENHETHGNVRQQYQCHNEYACHGKPKITHHLFCYDFIHLPRGIHFYKAESARNTRNIYQLI